MANLNCRFKSGQVLHDMILNVGAKSLHGSPKQQRWPLHVEGEDPDIWYCDKCGGLSVFYTQDKFSEFLPAWISSAGIQLR